MGGLSILYVVFQHVSPFWLEAAVAHVGGGFVFLAVHAVLDEILKHHKALVLTNFGFGFGAIAIVTLILRLL